MNSDKQQQLDKWWQSPLGRLVSESEQEFIASLSTQLTGYVQLQLGGNELILPPSCRPVCQPLIAANGDIHAVAEALPLKSHCIDNLLLLHVLEYAIDPHQVLRETERVLSADGKVIICAFNPYSLWGVRRLFSWQDKRPWDGHFFSHTRIKDWLALLNFEVIEHHKMLFRPAFKTEKSLNNSRFLERWGRRLWPCFGAVTILVATKRTIPLNPLRQNWRQRTLFPTPTLINKPITRNNKNGSR